MPLPRELSPPRDLTLPEPQSATARDILSRAVQRALIELRSLVHSHTATSPDVAAFGALLAVLLRDQLGPLASVLRRPHVGTLVRALRTPAPGATLSLLHELVAIICFELAVLEALPFAVHLRSSPRRWLSMVAAVAVEWPDDPREIVLSAGRAELRRSGTVHAIDLRSLGEHGDPLSGVVVRHPYHPIDGGTVLAVEDNNPLFLQEAHPDKSGNAVDLGGVPVSAWVASLRASFATVARYLPDLRAEMDLYLAQIVPVGAFADKHLSASYQEAIGTIYLSHHPHVMTMTEALIHEFQHTKINALFELDPVLENAFSPLFRSPVRPDPRPLHGVLLAIHAFVPVARLYEQMLAAGAPEATHPSFRARYAAIVSMNREAADVVLTHGTSTRVGTGILDELRRWDRHYRCAV